MDESATPEVRDTQVSYEVALANFAAALYELRIDAGAPAYKEIEKAARQQGRVSLSASAISEALQGKRLPSIDFTLELVRQLAGGDPRATDSWRERWKEVRLLQRSAKVCRAGMAASVTEDPLVHPDTSVYQEEAQAILRKAKEEAAAIVQAARARADELLNLAARSKETAKNGRTIAPSVARLLTRESTRLLLLGPPGAGKGTQATFLKKVLDVPHIHLGEILRQNIRDGEEAGLIAKHHIDRGGLVPDDVLIAMVNQRLLEADTKHGFLLDGFPYPRETLGALEEILAKDGLEVDVALKFEIPKSEAVKRIAGRRMCRNDSSHLYHLLYAAPQQDGACHCGGPLIARPDDSRSTIAERWVLWQQRTRPVSAVYGSRERLITVAGVGDVNDVTDRVISALTAFFG
ncbi:adenylate kinase family protein [Streptomyces buecherae]|uniref:Adenylate kinase n=1 Tax=Streptomyces buecherae TaxID=2763006 RepID=A0A7H8NGT5_9ACTN|nr:nucleoside monophosphate kinase [Streptomyces buecherae]QKW53606.1 nucleoside monophosphate kinase [Streptomyces buecherae]